VIDSGGVHRASNLPGPALLEKMRPSSREDRPKDFLLGYSMCRHHIRKEPSARHTPCPVTVPSTSRRVPFFPISMYS